MSGKSNINGLIKFFTFAKVVMFLSGFVSSLQNIDKNVKFKYILVKLDVSCVEKKIDTESILIKI